MTSTRFQRIALASASLLAAPALTAAQPAPVPMAATPAVSIPTASTVAALYDQFRIQPIWFKAGVPSTALTQLSQILRRARLDGLQNGPELAVGVENAVRQAASGNPADITNAEQTLSAAWALYVQTIKRPTSGMIYVYDVLKPQGSRGDQILLGAASAPNLSNYLTQTAAVNPIYSQIRDAEWARMQAAGTLVPDPKILANLERARSIPSRGKFVLVDVASQRLFMYENGAPVDSMKVIVGDTKLPTPMIASVMYYITYNPYWNAPDHLVKGPIAAKTLAGGKKYFDSMGYQVMADWTANSATIPFENVNWKDVAAGKTHVRVRQDPGPKNFMAQLKYPFANPQDIYLHDTPEKGPFSLANRARSNGCVRLEDAQRFGRWLLGREPSPPGTTPEIQVQLPRGVPIYITYLTAQPTGNGQIAWVKDEYGWDKPGAQVASTYISPAARAAN